MNARSILNVPLEVNIKGKNDVCSKFWHGDAFLRETFQ